MGDFEDAKRRIKECVVSACQKATKFIGNAAFHVVTAFKRAKLGIKELFREEVPEMTWEQLVQANLAGEFETSNLVEVEADNQSVTSRSSSKSAWKEAICMPLRRRKKVLALLNQKSAEEEQELELA